VTTVATSESSNQAYSIDYYDSFECLGSDCPDTCCQGWNIAVDKRVIELFQSKDKELGTCLSDSLIATDKQTQLKFSDDGYCHHFSQDRLCGLYAYGGSQMLPKACDTYPRLGIEYKAGPADLITYLSCPVSVDLAIFRDSPLRWVKNSTENATRLQLNQLPCLNETTYVSVKSLQNTVLKIMQLRDVSINRRLTAILLVAYKSKDLDITKDAGALRRIQELLDEMLDSKLDSVPELTPNVANQMSVLVEFSQGFIVNINKGDYANSDIARKTLSLFGDSFNGIGLSSFDELSDVHVRNYVLCQNEYVKPYFEANSHIIENLFAHSFMSSGFPCFTEGSMLDQFLLSVLNVLFIVGLLGGYAHYHQGINDEMVKRTIYLISRMTSHSAALREQMVALCKQLGAIGLGQIYTLFAR